jgi:precorrin-2 methylase
MRIIVEAIALRTRTDLRSSDRMSQADAAKLMKVGEHFDSITDV